MVMENNKKNQKGMDSILKTKGDDSQEIGRAQIKQKGCRLKIITAFNTFNNRNFQQ